MKIAYIAAGAAGMYCGSCLHDNTLAAALHRNGTDVALIPTYTPLRTDEDDVSIPHIFYGGINVFLQQKMAVFRHTPWFLDTFFDSPFLLRQLSRLSGATSGADLGALTVSVMKGEEGRQKKELAKLIAWLHDTYRPDLVHLTNSIFAGMAREMKRVLNVPILCSVQGEDLFLDALIPPFRDQARQVLRERAADVDGFVSPCRYYMDYMRAYLGVPEEKMFIVPLGLHMQGHGKGPGADDTAPFTIGYLARICPEKGLHILVDAFCLLADQVGISAVRLKIAGYCNSRDRRYFSDLQRRIADRGLAEAVEYRGEVNREEKIQFLRSLHVLSVPTVSRDPKGLFLLEALANGIPVVMPNHGAFPELIADTGGGILVEPDSPTAVADGLLQLMKNPADRQRMGQCGQLAVMERYNDEVMANTMVKVYDKFL